MDVAAVVAIEEVMREDRLEDFTDFGVTDSAPLAILGREVRTEAGLLVAGVEVMEAVAFIDDMRCR